MFRLWSRQELGPVRKAGEGSCVVRQETPHSTCFEAMMRVTEETEAVTEQNPGKCVGIGGDRNASMGGPRQKPP